MKTNRKHGFTIVELVIVIAIIAILAAVLIPTFTSIIKKANDSAYLQERQSQQIADLAEKVEKINYFTWEDFEKKLAEELAKVDTTDTAKIQEAVKVAMDQYQGEHASQNTGLTEDQVTKIVNEAMKGQLTTAQVEAIVNQAVSKIGGVNVADVQAIVKSAIAGMGQTGLNASQVKAQIAAALASSGLANKEAVEAAIAQALAKIENLTAEEVQAIVSKAVSDAIAESKPSASTVYIAGDMELDENITYILRTMNTLDSVVLTAPSGKTVTKVIIDAPNVKNVEIVGEGKVIDVEIQKTAESSTHVRVEVGTLVINSGRVVLESGAKVTGTLTAAPSTNANVIVELETGATVTNPVVAEYQDHGTGTNDTIKVIDNTANASVVLSASEALSESNTTTTNVVVEGTTDGTNTTQITTETSTTTAVLIAEVETTNTTTGETTTTVKESVNENVVARIGSTGYTTLQSAVEAAVDGDTITLLKDISLASTDRLFITKDITLNLNNKTIAGSSNQMIMIGVDSSITLTHSGHLTIRGNGSIVSSGNGSATGKDMLCVYADAVLDIYGGSYSSVKTAVFVNAGTFNTYGGDFTTTYGGANYLVCFDNAGVGNILAGNFTTGANGCYGLYLTNASIVNLGSIDSEGPTINTFRPCVASNGSESNEVTVNIYSGTFKANRNNITIDDQNVIQLANATAKTQTLNIYGGYFEQTSHSENSCIFTLKYSGMINLNIMGGTFNYGNNSKLFCGYGTDSSGYPSASNISVNVQNDIIPKNVTIEVYGKGVVRIPERDFVVNQ